MTSATQKRALGVRAILLYKACKAIVQAILAVVLTVLFARGELIALVHTIVHAIREVVPGMWSLHLAERILRGATRGHLTITIVALAADAALSALEAWALWRGRWWGPWLIVMATSLLIPFEIFELIRRPRVIRAAVLVLNVVVVAYLAQRALREHRARIRVRTTHERVQSVSE